MLFTITYTLLSPPHPDTCLLIPHKTLSLSLSFLPPFLFLVISPFLLVCFRNRFNLMMCKNRVNRQRIWRLHEKAQNQNTTKHTHAHTHTLTQYVVQTKRYITKQQDTYTWKNPTIPIPNVYYECENLLPTFLESGSTCTGTGAMLSVPTTVASTANTASMEPT